MYPNRISLLDILLKSSLALIASALILLAAFAMYSASWHREATTPPDPLILTGKSLQAIAGSAREAGDAIAFDDFEPYEGKRVAIAVWRGRIPADDYPLLKYQVDADSPGPALKLIWRTTEDPSVLRSANIQGTDGASSWLELSRNPHWRGTVVELGIYADTSDERDRLSIAHLTLQPRSWRGEVASRWSDWTGHRGWTHRSINRLYGSVDITVLSPVPVAAAWSALAVLLLISGLFSRRVPAGAMAAAVLLPWIALDMLWQKELVAQLARTRDQFEGKSVVEKHLADMDRHLYRYITRLKNEVLPAGNSRILVLRNARAHNFDRLKAQYYLLPHNVFNFGRVPPDRGLEHIDFILALGELPLLDYNDQTHSLQWKNGKRSVRVELMDDDFMGKLYRVLPPPEIQGDAN